MADGDAGEFRAVPFRRDRDDFDMHARAAVRLDMQAEFGRAAGHRAADVDEIAIALGARADHGIGEHDRIRFAPGDLRAEARAMLRLIGRAGEGRQAAEREMGLHQALAAAPTSALAAKQFGMDEVDRADVERRRNAHAASQRDEALDEIEARAAEIEAAVDMRGLDVEKPRRVDRLGEFDAAGASRKRRPRPCAP